ncbi:MAG: PIG-L family deacetylase [Planctomycetota bacterium]
MTPPFLTSRRARSVAACLAGAMSGVAPRAQTLDVMVERPTEVGYVALHQAARDAATDQLALIIASHPDDRYVMPAAYLRFAQAWNVAALLLTRGEGGQNSLGSTIGDELGWQRTLEAEAGAAMLDVRVWYLNRQDAGYCRTAREALELWGRDDTVVQLARLLRVIRPDVVLTTHGPDETHGHDLALLEVLPDALALAAEPEAGAAELAGLAPIQIARALRAPSATELPQSREILPVEQVDRVRGDTYRRLAYRALKRHRSQEPIRPMDELFEPVVPLYPMRRSDVDDPESWTLAGVPDAFDRLAASRAAASTKLRRRLQDLVTLVGDGPQMIDEALELREELAVLAAEVGPALRRRLERRIAALERVLIHAIAVRVRASVADRGVSADRPFPVLVRVQHAGGPRLRNLRLRAMGGAELRLEDPDSDLLQNVPETPFDVRGTYAPPDAAADRQAWLAGVFRADTFEPPLRLECRLDVVDPETQTRRAELSLPVVLPVDARPAAEIEVTPRALLLERETEAQSIAVRVTRHIRAPLSGLLEILGPPGFEVGGSPVPVHMTAVDFEDFRFDLRVPPGLKPGVYNLHLRLDSLRSIVPLHKIDVRVPANTAVGLIPGVDDAARMVLRGLVGDQLEILEEEQLALGQLDLFDTIVVDIRALRERADNGVWRAARAAFPRLLEFVRLGGRLVVFYHKDTEFNAAAAGFEGWPYPLRLGKGRVTREDAPVEMLDPEHRLLTYPNVIRAEDWDGWVQERGLYFPEDYADAYQEVLAMGDPGDEKMRGALLYATYGQGEYIYCALSLYRQLKSLHPGACRIFANLVSR